MQEHRVNKADYWGRFSATYDEKVERLIGKDLRPALACQLEQEPAPGNVLELGCGTGYFTRAMAKNATHVTATDVSRDMLAAANRNLKDLNNVTFQVENGEATSFPPDTFDTVLMANLLHMLDDPLKALKECRRLLKKGGTLLIINYTDQEMGRAERIWMLFRFALLFGIPPKKSWPVTGESLRQQLKAAGFVIDRMSLLRDRINAFYVKAKKV
jgi:ubiquinone/menaquinone biosynthesis C-methylase UbiE